ncbi:hypothetical protein KC363_g7602 [Hortaea werneckii]|nr:hypothetical protein KC363_g7602 [Hortaea werneckii]
MDRVLPYRMLDDCQHETENDEIREYEEVFVALVEGRIDVTAAAQQITNTVYDQVMRRRRLSDTANESQTYPTNISLVSIGIGSMASSFPPSHAAHLKLLDLLKAFMTLEPKLRLPNPIVDNSGNILPSHVGLVDESQAKPILLWISFDELLFEVHLPQLAHDGLGRWMGVEKACSEEQARWRNLSFFFARLTTAGMADLRHVSALFMLSPKLRLPKTSPGWSGHLAAQVLAAAQWIVPNGHGAWLWQQCRVNTQSEGVQRCDWTVGHWSEWKDAFKEVAELYDDPMVPGIARRLSSTALEVMSRLESEDPVA